MRDRSIDLIGWGQLDLIDQKANIGAEVGRTFNARRAGDLERYWGAIERAVDLFEATVLAANGREPYRMREVSGAKEEYLRIAGAEDFDENDARALEAYFTGFALMSRARRD